MIKEKKWQLIVLADGYLLLRSPKQYLDVDSWHKWGEIQVKVISSFQKYFEGNHLFMYYIPIVPERIRQLIKVGMQGEYDEIIAKRKSGETIYLLPDVQNRKLIEILLESVAEGCIVILDQKPPNWKELLAILFEISKSNKAALKIKEMSVCRCLCYFKDRDLVIEKIDLPENTVFTILEHIAKEEGLKLVVNRK
jgi:hypothetical protein